MKNIMGILFFLFGLFFIFFHSRLGQFASDLWYNMYPNIKIWKKGYDIFFLTAGLAFAFFGIAIVFEIIKLK